MKQMIASILSLTLAGAAVAADAPAKPAKARPKEDAVLTQIDDLIQKTPVDKSKTSWRTSLKKPTLVTFESGKSYFVRMQTSKGAVRIRFMPDTAPMHVTSFLYLTRLGFYDGLTFHRVIPGFMAQGGCPLGTGTGSPGYEFAGEFKPSVKHDRPGLLSMANAGPGTDGSQFFLTFKATPWLDGKHTIFGEVVEGKETLAALEATGSQSGRTSEPLKIEKVTIEVE